MKRMSFRPLTALVSLALLVGASPARADTKVVREPTPIDVLVVRATCVFVGTVLDIEENTWSGSAYPGAKETATWKFARVRIDEGLIGTRGLTQVRVGFLADSLKAGSEGCFFLNTHHDQDFFECGTWEQFIDRNAPKGRFIQASFEEGLTGSRKLAKLLENPRASLRSKDPKDRLWTAAALLYRYRPVRDLPNPPTEPVDEEISQLILDALLQADWETHAYHDVSPWGAFCRLELKAEDGWDRSPYSDKALVWLKKHAATYRIRRVVGKEPPLKAQLSASELRSLLSDLEGDDDTRIRHAMKALAAVPQQTIPFFREKVKPVFPADTERVAPLLADLDSDQFKVRERATAELGRLGESAAPLLRKQLQEKPPPEVRQRIEQLLAEAAQWTPERLQGWRTVLVLEDIGSDEARSLLGSFSKGAAETRLTEEAKAALKRLAARTGAAP